MACGTSTALASESQNSSHTTIATASAWAVILSRNDQLIGDCGLQFLPGRQDLELGFHIARQYWGDGYGFTRFLYRTEDWWALVQ